MDILKIWDPWTTIQAAREFERYDVSWIEEPVCWDDQVGGMAMIASATDIPVAAGESECTLYACRDLIEGGGVKIVQADTVTAGGFTQLRKIADVASAYHAWVAPHGASYPEICAHLVAAVPNGLIVSAFPSTYPDQIWSRLYKEPLEISNGWIEMPQAPGLGMKLDEGFIEKHRIKCP